MDMPLPAEIAYDDGTTRLVLRPACLADVDALLEAIHESLSELRAFMPWAHFRQTHASQTERIKALEEGYHTGGEYVFHAFEPNAGGSGERFVGCFGFHDRTLNKAGAELGYWVRTGATGRGIATLASKILVLTAFRHLNCQRLQCAYNEANAGSAAVQRRVGFKEEGRLRFFEMQGDEVMRHDGYRVAPHTVMNALTADDVAALPWCETIEPHLKVSFAVG